MKRRKDLSKISQYNMSEGNCSFQYEYRGGFYYYYIVEDGLGLIASCRVGK